MPLVPVCVGCQVAGVWPHLVTQGWGLGSPYPERTRLTTCCHSRLPREAASLQKTPESPDGHIRDSAPAAVVRWETNSHYKGFLLRHLPLSFQRPASASGQNSVSPSQESWCGKCFHWAAVAFQLFQQTGIERHFCAEARSFKVPWC